MRKIGFVTPWYGAGNTGGAETELSDLVLHLSKAGIALEVLTTCAKSFRDDWNVNHYREGSKQENGILVRRFPVRKRDTAAFDAVNAKLIRGEKITAAEEKVFCREMINSPRLYEFIQKKQSEYEAFVFIPYMFGTTYYGCQACLEKAVLIPCLHDESYAYMQCFRDAFSKVRGMVFNAEPERILAKRLYGVEGDGFVTFGIGMDTDWSFDAARFRRKYKIDDPFVLYAGRKEAGKRVDVLASHFALYKKRHNDRLKLVMIGGGQIENPDQTNIIDLGFVDKQDKYDAYAAASVFCNPSEMESFSLVIMESWLAGRPVLVNGACAVTRDFVCQSNGGLYFENYWEFEKCLEYMMEHRDISDQMGRNGGAYVREHFAWNVIIRRYREFFDRIGERA